MFPLLLTIIVFISSGAPPHSCGVAFGQESWVELTNRPKEPNLICNSNNINNMAIFGIIVNQVVTIVGVPSYTSGDQLCKGAAAILNRNPINIKLNPKLIP